MNTVAYYTQTANGETWDEVSSLEDLKMTLSYGDVSRFVRDNGDVKAFAERSEVTLLKNGNIDSVAFIEKDAVRFEYEGRSYSREEFEKLVPEQSERGKS
jgi:hypothetical protein